MGYEPFDTTTVCAFAEPYLPGRCGAVDAVEVGDGNLNLVFKVRAADGPGVVVKQALPYLRLAGEGWPLTTDRARIEAAALELHGGLAPGRVPQLLHYDPEQFAMVMEDLADHVTLRTGMNAEQRYADAFAHLGEYAARTLLGTSDLLLAADEKKALHLRFHNPELCAITEDLVFTAPFVDAESNQVDDDLVPHAERLRADRAAVRAAARLRFEFRSRHEAVVHGDLHTGSVMVTPADTRVIDPEFACPGPMAFDTGKLLGNLALAHLGHRAQGHDAYAADVARWAADFWEAFVDAARALWPAGEPWRDAFLADLLADSARYAGAVMCRRAVGLAGVSDIRGIADRAVRLRAEVDALAGGAALLTAGRVGTLDDLWGLATATPAYA